MVASLRPVVAPSPVGRRAFAVFAVAGLALTSMAVGLGLAFPGGIGSRAGAGAGVTPILVTPARQTQRAVPTAPVAPVVTSETARPATATSSATPRPQATSATPAAPTTTVPPDVLNQVNQTVSDVLGTLIPPQNTSR